VSALFDVLAPWKELKAALDDLAKIRKAKSPS
jgi:hypothetical protein